MYLEITDPKRSAWLSVVMMLLTALVGFLFVGPMIGFLLAIPAMEDGFIRFMEKLSDPGAHPELKMPLFIMQGSATLFGLILIPWLYIKGIVKKDTSLLYRQFPIQGFAFGVAAVTLFTFMVVNSFFIEWNANLDMPEFMKGFEKWARARESLAAELTKLMTQFDTPGEFLVGFFVVAVLPGIGEELVFRGMVQPELHRATNNIHAAIWISALLFSTIHMQFFGFVPRLLLGALFGYLYYWSGNIALPMFVHFFNNGLSVVMIYLHQLGYIGFDIESAEAAAWPVVAVFTAITCALLYYLRSYFKSRNPYLT